ncbi:MAG: ABC transporter permease [Gaiellaceae bacterium]|jgi:ABC-2 type transport system permease protein
MAVTLRGIWVVAYRELLRFVRERTRIASSLLMPIIFMIVFSEGLKRQIGSLAVGVDFVKFMYPGIVAMSVFINAIFSGLSVVWDREIGFLKEVLVSPLNRSGVVFGKALGAAVIALFQTFVMLALAPLFDVSISFDAVLELIPIVIVLALSLAGFGLLIGSRMRSQQGFQLLVQAVVFPLTFLAGVFFPVNNVPRWMEIISKINPLTYGVDAIRRIFLAGEVQTPPGFSSHPILGVTVFGHTTSMIEDVALVGLFGAVLLIGAVFSFNRQV